MKKFIKWMHRHHNSISSFMSNFIATVLGIVLTLGTTVLYDYHQKKEAAKVLVEQCLANMEERLADLDKVIEYYDLNDSIIQVMNTTPLDSLNDDDLNYFLVIASEEQNVLIVNQTYEKLFAQSSNSLETLGRFSQVIGEGFEILKYTEEKHAIINKLKNDLLREMILSRNTYYDKGSLIDVVKTLVSDPHYFIFCSEYAKHVNSVRYMHGQLKNYIPAARRLWQNEITEEEFWAGARGGWR